METCDSFDERDGEEVTYRSRLHCTAEGVASASLSLSVSSFMSMSCPVSSSSLSVSCPRGVSTRLPGLRGAAAQRLMRQ
ncbi:unnamed protein product [Lampetra planeri]